MNIIDMHCDTLSALLEYKRKGHSSELRKQDTQIDLEKMKKKRLHAAEFRSICGYVRHRQSTGRSTPHNRSLL